MNLNVVVTKSTQASKRYGQLIKDLINNPNFVKRFNQIKTEPLKKRPIMFLKLLKKYDLFSVEIAGYLTAMSTESNPDLKILELTTIDKCIFLDKENYANENPLNIYHKDLIDKYPIEIRISPNASQRDILDFIRSKWNMINSTQNEYLHPKKRLRLRTKEDRDKFIWKLRNEPKSIILDEIDKKYPEEELSYENIYSIINIQKKRLSKK